MHDAAARGPAEQPPPVRLVMAEERAGRRRAYAEAPAKADWWNDVLSERMLVLLILGWGVARELLTIALSAAKRARKCAPYCKVQR